MPYAKWLRVTALVTGRPAGPHTLQNQAERDIQAIAKPVKWRSIDLFVLFFNNLQHASAIAGADDLLMAIDSSGNTTAIN